MPFLGNCGQLPFGVKYRKPLLSGSCPGIGSLTRLSQLFCQDCAVYAPRSLQPVLGSFSASLGISKRGCNNPPLASAPPFPLKSPSLTTMRVAHHCRAQGNKPPESLWFLDNLKSQIATSSWGGARVPPYAFTDQGWPCCRVCLQPMKSPIYE